MNMVLRIVKLPYAIFIFVFLPLLVVMDYVGFRLHFPEYTPPTFRESIHDCWNAFLDILR